MKIRRLIKVELLLQVSFTGSTQTGHLIMQAAASSNLKQVCLELGGKSPFIVFDDVDVDKTAPLALTACFFNQVSLINRLID